MSGFKLGNTELAHGLILAPMAGVTDRAFRIIAKHFGAELTVSEMISAKAVWYKDKKTALLSEYSSEEEPISLQIFGREPEIMAHAATVLSETHPSIVSIDINMGCPVPKVAGNGEGSALMRDPILAGRIVRAVSDAIKLPVTVKMRTGWDESSINAPYLAELCEQNGAAMVCVHGRTRKQFYAPPVEFDTVAEVKRRVKIPVVLNGGIYSAEDAVNALRYSDCDGVALAQGVMGDPWLFSRVADMLDGKTPKIPTSEEKLKVALWHLDMLIDFKGEYIGTREARRQMSYYLKGEKGSAAIRNALNHSESRAEIAALMEKAMLQT